MVFRGLPLVCVFILALTAGVKAFAVDFGTRAGANDWRDVAALARDTSFAGKGPYKIFCSGVVVHPKVILTAAHCVQEGGVRPGAGDLRQFAKSIRVHFGPGRSGGKVDDTLREVEKIFLHPDYLREIRGFSDIAIVVLKEPAPIAPSAIRPLLLDLVTLKRKLLPSKMLTVVGYGYSDQSPAPEIFGLKHFGQIRVDGKTANEIQIVGGAGAAEKIAAPRDGDSGGPVFYRDETGAWQLAGLVSRAVRHNHGAFGSALSLVRNSVCWIEAQTGVKLRRDPAVPDYCRQSPEADGAGDFLAACTNPASAPLSAQYTIYVLQQLLGQNDCRALHETLSHTTNLSLDATYISDLRPLAGFTQLERLSVRDNDIRFVAPLVRLEKLRLLDISYNNVRDFDRLEDLQARGLWLVGSGRQAWNIARTGFIRACANAASATAAVQDTIDAIFATLDMKPGQCVNANYELIRLRRFEFYKGKGLTDMSPLASLKTLDHLDLSGQAVSDLGFLRTLEGLDSLVLDGNPARDLSPLADLRYLRELSIQDMGLTDVSQLQGLKRLRVLRVKGNKIKDFSPLSALERDGLTIEGKAQQNSH